MSTFEERRNIGYKAEDALYEYCYRNNIAHIDIVSRKQWETVEKWSPAWEILRKLDQEQGDTHFPIINENVDIKLNSITFSSLDNFKHTYYIVYRADLQDVIVVKKQDIQKLDTNDYDIIRITSRGEEIRGYKYDRLIKNVPYITLDKFFGITSKENTCEKTNEVFSPFKKNALSTEKAAEDIRLHFLNGSTTPVTWKIKYISAYMKAIKAKDSTFMGYSYGDGEIIHI